MTELTFKSKRLKGHFQTERFKVTTKELNRKLFL